MSEKIQNTIKNLLERAAHPETPAAEQAACQQKAEDLMRKYRIDAALLAFGNPEQGRKVLTEEFEVIHGEFAKHLKSMQFGVYLHAKCRIASGWNKFTVVGYEDDIFYAGLMWSNIHLDFISKMLPKWTRTRSFEENVYMLKESGKSWMDIVHAAPQDANLTAKSGSRLRTAYNKHAKSLGIDLEEKKAHPRNPKLWRESFAESYAETLNSRLRIMAANAERDNTPSEKGALALISDQSRVDAEFYKLFPHLDPEDYKRRVAEADEREAARREALGAKGREREDRAEAARLRRLANRRPKYRKFDHSAGNAGAEAANNVDLTGRTNRVGRTSKEIG